MYTFAQYLWHAFAFILATYGSEGILNINQDVLITLRWFSIGSQTIAHWTLFCLPDGKPNNTVLFNYSAANKQ